MSKEAILSDVKSALKNKHFRYQKEEFKKPLKIDSSKDALSDFISRWEANMGKVLKSSEESLEEDLIGLVNKISPKSFFYTSEIEQKSVQNLGKLYEKSVDELRNELFHADLFMLKANCAIRDLGIIGVKSSPASGRLASLIADTCIFVLAKEDLVENMLEGVRFLSKDLLATNTLLIAGPSRTADIELQTVFGVHGPRETWLVIY